MIVKHIGKHRIGVVNLTDKIAMDFEGEKLNLEGGKWVSKSRVDLRKSETQERLIYAPYSMIKLMDMEDKSEYVAGCMRAIREFSIMQIECANPNVKTWFENSYFPDDDPLSLIQECVANYKSCGNGLLLKARDLTGKWAGLDRLLPNECIIVERYENNIPTPNYMQVRNNKRALHDNKEVIHIKQLSRKSNFWGLPKLSHVKDVYTLDEIDTYNYNNFKNGLLVDYICFISGGTLRGNEVTDDDGNVIEGDAYDKLETTISDAQGTNAAHGMILVEFEGTDTKIEMHPMRQDTDGGFLKLKDKLVEGLYTYYGTPKRIVAQAVSGELGGSDNSDMILFYYGTIKNIQRKLAIVLARNFRDEFGWDVKPEDFDFGNVIDLFKSPDDILFEEINQSPNK